MTRHNIAAVVNDISPGIVIESKDYVGQGRIIGFYKVAIYNLYNDDEKRKEKRVSGKKNWWQNWNIMDK